MQFLSPRACGLLAFLAVTACSDQPTEAPIGSPLSDIVDATRTPAAAGFNFLAPLVATPAAFAGPFDPAASPVVDICLPVGRACALPLIARFTMGKGSASVRVSTTDEHYIVNWHTSGFPLDPSRTYRIRVRVGGTDLGYADVKLVRNGNEAKSVDASRFVAVNLGSTVPIKFRIEKGAVPPVGPSHVALAQTGSVSANVGVGGGLLTTVGDDGVRYTLDIPANALRSTVQVRMTPIARAANLKGDMSFAAGVHFAPEGLVFWKAATLTMTFPTTVDQRSLYGFTYSADGADLGVRRARTTASSLAVPVWHFSGAGAVTSDAASAMAAASSGDRHAPFRAELAVVARDADNAGRFLSDDPRTMDIFNRWVVVVLAQLASAHPPTTHPADDPMRALHESEQFIRDVQGANVEDNGLIKLVRDAQVTLMQALVAALDTECRKTNNYALVEKAMNIARIAEGLHLATLDNGLTPEEVQYGTCTEPKVMDIVVLDGEPLLPEQPADLVIRAGLSYAKQPPVARPLTVTFTIAGTTEDGTRKGMTDQGGAVALRFTPKKDARSVDVTVHACLLETYKRLAGICADSSRSFKVKQPIKVAVKPPTITLDQGQQTTFSEEVENSTQGVVWSAEGGSIDQKGMYTAGKTAGKFMVTAKAVEDPNAIGTAEVTIRDITLEVAPQNARTNVNQALQFTALVSGTIDKAVMWSASGGTITSQGSFTSTEPGDFVVTAKHASGKQASANVTVDPDGLARVIHMTCAYSAFVHATTQAEDKQSSSVGEPNNHPPCKGVSPLTLMATSSHRGSTANVSLNGSFTGGAAPGYVFSSLTIGATAAGTLRGTTSSEEEWVCDNWGGGCAMKPICAGSQCSYNAMGYTSSLNLLIVAEVDIDLTVTVTPTVSCANYDASYNYSNVIITHGNGSIRGVCNLSATSSTFRLLRGHSSTFGHTTEMSGKVQLYGPGNSGSNSLQAGYTMTITARAAR